MVKGIIGLENKMVKFCGNVNVVLIPDREELSIVKNKLWWDLDDYSTFRKESINELKIVVSFSKDSLEKELLESNIQISENNLLKLAQSKTYQPK